MKYKYTILMSAVWLTAIVCGAIFFRAFKTVPFREYNVYTNTSDIDLAMIALGEREKQAGIK